MLDWLGVMMAAIVTGWLAVMLWRERAYRKRQVAHKRKGKFEELQAIFGDD